MGVAIMSSSLMPSTSETTPHGALKPSGAIQKFPESTVQSSASSMRREPFSPTQTWGERRQHFIARHLAQYKRKKTPRRALALRMWAFDTGDGALDAYL